MKETEDVARCGYMTDSEAGKFFVPQCIGGAVYGPGGCTCNPKAQRKALEQKLIELEEHVAKLEKRTG